MSSDPQIYYDSSDDDEQYVNENGFIHFQFADVSKSNKVVTSLGKYDPKKHYMTVYSGLNMKGMCTKQSCVAFNKPVWAKKDYGQFSIAEEIDQVKCPMCQQCVPPETVKTLGYRNCKVKIVGKKLGENKKIQWEDKEDSGKFVKFEGYDGKTIQWSYLRLTVTKL